MSLSRTLRALVATGVATAVAGSVLASPSTAAAPTGKTIDNGLLSPLSVAVNDRGHVYYSENFAGVLHVKKPGKPAKVVYTSTGGAEVGGISTSGKAVYFISGTKVMKRTAKGKVRTLADIGAYEARKNPDGKVTYGAVGLSAECAEQWPTGEGAPPPSYTGIVEAHPYATAVLGDSVYVADAAANAIFRVRKGKVRTVALLPPVEVAISPAFAETAGLPDCAIGKKYRFEGVPTDVEAQDGKLYVTGLPGGPEDGSVSGSVFRINPAKGKVKRIATGFVGANGLAVAADGNIYVAELFAGKVTRITPKGKKRTFVKVPLPGAVELDGKRVLVTQNVLSGLAPGEEPAGSLVRYRR